MVKPLYEIVEWDATYECSQSRKEQRNRWVAIPNKHDGRGFNRIALHKKSVELFAAWILIVQVASKMPVRGVLSDKDGPLTAEDIALKTRFPSHIFELALSYLILPEIGWMRVSNPTGSALVAHSEHTGSALVAGSELHDSTLHDTTGHDNTPQDNIVVSGKLKQSDVVEVFKHWCEILNHPRAQLDAKRSKLISGALKLGYTVDDLKLAIDGNKASDWHQGKNDRSKVFDSLDLIFRNADQIDKFIADASGRGIKSNAHNVSKHEHASINGVILTAEELQEMTSGPIQF